MIAQHRLVTFSWWEAAALGDEFAAAAAEVWEGDYGGYTKSAGQKTAPL
jgi:hypothetical protein